MQRWAALFNLLPLIVKKRIPVSAVLIIKRLMFRWHEKKGIFPLIIPPIHVKRRLFLRLLVEVNLSEGARPIKRTLKRQIIITNNRDNIKEEEEEERRSAGRSKTIITLLQCRH